MNKPSRFRQQEAQYEFPYHFVPHIQADGTAMRTRGMNWGFEYLCYQRHIADLVLSYAPKSLLEVGCGDGRFVGMLGSAVPRRVGVDLAPRAIAFARAFHPDVAFFCQPAEQLEEIFDVVAAVEVLEHIPDGSVTAFLNALFARTRYEGRVVISVPTVVRPVHPKHYRHYDESLLQQQLDETGVPFRVERLEHIYAAPRYLEQLFRFTCNRHLTLEIGLLNRAVWRYLWNRRVTRAGVGCHMVAVVQRL